jgi:hypothetical protein
MRPRLLVAVATCSLATACSSGPATTGDGSQSFATDRGKLQVELVLSPQPIAAGVDSAAYTVTDPTTHAPVDGLTLAIVPWMPAMGHGTSVVPTVTPAGSGQYTITDLSLFMPGEWQLRTKFTGQVDDSAEPTFSVP